MPATDRIAARQAQWVLAAEALRLSEAALATGARDALAVSEARLTAAQAELGTLEAQAALAVAVARRDAATGR